MERRVFDLKSDFPQFPLFRRQNQTGTTNSMPGALPQTHTCRGTMAEDLSEPDQSHHRATTKDTNNNTSPEPSATKLSPSASPTAAVAAAPPSPMMLGTILMPCEKLCSSFGPIKQEVDTVETSTTDVSSSHTTNHSRPQQTVDLRAINMKSEVSRFLLYIGYKGRASALGNAEKFKNFPPKIFISKICSK